MAGGSTISDISGLLRVYPTLQEGGPLRLQVGGVKGTNILDIIPGVSGGIEQRMRQKDRAMNLKVSEQPEELELKRWYSTKLQKTLGLDGSPVAMAIVSELPGGLGHLQYKATACMMIQIARRGLAFCSSGDGILCGGRANLGVGESPIRKLDEFLVRSEKLFGSTAAARRLIDSAKKHAARQGRHLAFSPLEKASFPPDVVLFIGTPAQISRIIFLDAFETGDIEALHGEPLCSGAIATPISTGKIGISFLDMACRQFGRYKPEEMIVGVPYLRLSHIVDSIDLSSAGTARPDLLLRLAGTLLRRRVPSDSR